MPLSLTWIVSIVFADISIVMLVALESRALSNSSLTTEMASVSTNDEVIALVVISERAAIGMAWNRNQMKRMSDSEMIKRKRIDSSALECWRMTSMNSGG